MHVDGDNPGRAGTLQDSDRQRTDRTTADHERRFSFDVSRAAYSMPSDTGGLNQGGSAEIQVLRKRAQHP
ncbi:hypothetical protein D3C73_1417570 [compost metagenome]